MRTRPCSTSAPASRKQHLEDHLGFLVLAFAEVVVPDPTLRVGEVQSRPVVVVERPPDGVVVVDRHRVADVHLLEGAAHVVEVTLEVELGRLYADDHQPLHSHTCPPTLGHREASGSS